MEKEIYDQRLVAVDYTIEAFSPLEANDCVFERCNFQQVDLRSKKFVDCEFIGSNLTLANLLYSTFRNCKFVDCKLTGINWSTASKVSDCEFLKCNLSTSVMMNLDLRHAKFIECILREVDFSDADMKKASLDSSDLQHATFRGTDLTEADFSTAKNYEIDPLHNKIKKAKFSLPEAVGLLSGLGIVLV